MTTSSRARRHFEAVRRAKDAERDEHWCEVWELRERLTKLRAELG